MRVTAIVVALDPGRGLVEHSSVRFQSKLSGSLPRKSWVHKIICSEYYVTHSGCIVDSP